MALPEDAHEFYSKDVRSHGFARYLAVSGAAWRHVAQAATDLHGLLEAASKPSSM